MNAIHHAAGTRAAGTATAFTRRLDGPVDLLALYAQLSDGGQRPDTLLIQTIAGASMILDRAAVRIECRGQQVTFHSLSAGGAGILRIVERLFAASVADRADDRLVVRFEKSHALDAEVRLLAPSPFDALRALTSALSNATPDENFAVCLMGVVAFDHVDLFEDLPQQPEDPLGFPDYIFWLAESAVIAEPGLPPRLVCSAFGSANQDDARRGAEAAAERLADLSRRAIEARQFLRETEPAPCKVAVDLDDREFAATVSRLKEHILAGDVYQIVASRTFSAPCADPLAAFDRLRATDPSPYMFYVAMADGTLFGASPETSVRVFAEGGERIVEVKPIAGTRPRGCNRDEDDRMEVDLRLDEKEVAEHMMLVDLARNDVAQVAVPGTRRVDGLMSVERYARVMHLVSSVKGSLALGYDALHALRACLNVGTLSGAPKLKATELLRVYERNRRGHYGGAIGWLNGNGLLDSGVVIRAAMVKDGTAFVRAGAGVVYDSDPAAEAEETRRKAAAVLSAITGDPA